MWLMTRQLRQDVNAVDAELRRLERHPELGHPLAHSLDVSSTLRLIDLPCEVLIHMAEQLLGTHSNALRARRPGHLPQLANTCREMRILLRPQYMPYLLGVRQKTPPVLIPRGEYCVKSPGVRFQGCFVWHRYLLAALIFVLASSFSYLEEKAIRAGWIRQRLGWLPFVCVVLTSSPAIFMIVCSAHAQSHVCALCGEPYEEHTAFCEAAEDLVPRRSWDVLRFVTGRRVEGSQSHSTALFKHLRCLGKRYHPARV